MKNRWFYFASAVVIFSMLLAACTPAAPATQAPVAAPTEAPVQPTAVPAQPTAAAQAQPTVAEPAQPAACPAPVGKEPVQPPAAPKTITGGWTQEPDNIAPFYTTMTYAAWVAQLTLAGLGEWNEKGEFVPELAADVPTKENGGISADGLTITWKLKPCLYWSDGEPLTSKDIKFTWEQDIDPKNAVSTTTGYSLIESIETPDDLTAVLKFKELFPPWQTLFTQGPNNYGSILPEHMLKGKTELHNDPFIHWPTVSSGPWVIAEWIPGDHMTLLPNPNFYGGRPKLDQIQLKFIPDPETALAALKTGDIDWYPDFSESDIETISALEPDIHLTAVPGSEFEYFVFNLGSTAGMEGQPNSKADADGPCPLKDVNVRKAIILGTNRQQIVDTLLAGKTTVPSSNWPDKAWNNAKLPVDAYNPDEAMKLLDSAGYKPGPDGVRVGQCGGKEAKLSFDFETTDKQLRVDVAVAVQADLKKIGVEFKPHHTPGGTFFGTYPEGGILGAGKFDIAGFTTGYYPDPYPNGGDWDCNVASKDNPGGTTTNFMCDLKLVDLFKQVNASADPVARKAALDAVQQYIYDNSLVMMMYTRALVYGSTDRLVFGPNGFMSGLNWNSEVWDVKQ